MYYDDPLVAAGFADLYKRDIRPLIKKMAGRALELYRDKTTGRQKPKTFDLPERLEEVMREIVEKFHDKVIIWDMPQILDSRDSHRDIMLRAKYLQFYNYFQHRIRRGPDYILWCCMCFVFAAQLCARDYVTAALVAMEVIYDITVQSDNLFSFAEFITPREGEWIDNLFVGWN